MDVASVKWGHCGNKTSLNGDKTISWYCHRRLRRWWLVRLLRDEVKTSPTIGTWYIYEMAWTFSVIMRPCNEHFPVEISYVEKDVYRIDKQDSSWFITRDGIYLNYMNCCNILYSFSCTRLQADIRCLVAAILEFWLLLCRKVCVYM